MTTPKKPRRRRLTAKVRAGLRTMMSVYDAGAPADFIGGNDRDRSPERRRTIDELNAAAAWIESLPRKE